MVFNTPQKCFTFLSTASRSLLHHSKPLRDETVVRCAASLSEVGVLESPKTEGVYATGQLFLHAVFGYRGIVLFPWKVRLYDRDEAVKGKDDQTYHVDVQTAADTAQGKKDCVALNTEMYYQVLIDSRDGPYIRAQTESVTFLGSQGKGFYAITGLDYASQSDILPYASDQKSPIMHELFDRFLSYDPNRLPPFVKRHDLTAFQQKNHSCLLISEVHRQTTEDVRVTVAPFFMGSRQEEHATVKYWWRYIIRLENLGDLAVQLRERHWKIFSQNGTLDEVKGRGVIAREPVLSRAHPAFQYSSHVSLESPSGHMWGQFKMEREDGFAFECKIPPFSLESKWSDVTGPGPNGNNQTPPSSPPPLQGGADDEDLPPEDGSWGNFPFFIV